MKKTFTLFLILLICFNAFSQSQITSISYNKNAQPALMLDLPYDENTIEDFIVANLKKTGYNPETKGKLFWKQNKLDGFYIFKDVKLEDASQAMDLYFKVDQKSRRAKDQSVIYLMLSKGGENFISPGTDETNYEAAKKFLNGFVDNSAAYKLGLDIKEQEEVVKDAEKKYDKLKDHEKDMIRKIEQLEKDLKENREDQDKQDKTIKDQKKKLEDLRDQLKKY